jgi:hypothetical protein
MFLQRSNNSQDVLPRYTKNVPHYSKVDKPLTVRRVMQTARRNRNRILLLLLVIVIIATVGIVLVLKARNISPLDSPISNISEEIPNNSILNLDSILSGMKATADGHEYLDSDTRNQQPQQGISNSASDLESDAIPPINNQAPDAKLMPGAQVLPIKKGDIVPTNAKAVVNGIGKADVAKQEEIVREFRHAWDSYVEHAFGFDDFVSDFYHIVNLDIFLSIVHATIASDK